MGLLRLALQDLCFARRLSDCRLIDSGRAREILDALCRDAGITRSIRLLAVPAEGVPAALGLWRWSILLPEGAARRFSDAELRALLAHELGHLVRRDSAWLWMGRVLCTCFAFQPLNRLARLEWQRAAEFLCDDWAVARTGNRLALARCLIEVAGWKLGRSSPAAVSPVTGRSSSLSSRVERLIADAPPNDAAEKDSWRTAVSLLAAVAVVAAMVGWAPKVAVTAPRSSEPATVDRTSSHPENPEDQPAAPPLPLSNAEDPVRSAPAEALAAQSADPGAAWQELEAELQGLQADIEAVQRLLRQMRPSDQALAARWQRHLVQLRQRQQSLALTLRPARAERSTGSAAAAR
jgi:hypothetical protein